MKKILFIALMLIFYPVSGMLKQEDGVITKLKLVLTAGRHVYGEHKTIHVDAKQRAQEIVDLFNISQEMQVADCLNKYSLFLMRVIATYQQHARNPHPDILADLEASHRCCLKWGLAIPTGKCINRFAWRDLRAAFLTKIQSADQLFHQADTAYGLFGMGHDISQVLSLSSAVKAWCILLPDPVLSRVKHNI